MNNTAVLKYILIIFTFLGGWSCAKVGQPSGGMRDRIPPVVVKSEPENGSVNFRGRRIEIEFNEYVTLDNINEKLMISPPLTKRPGTLLRGKSLIIEYDEQLRDSATYSFYFLDAIRDLNESNILENYKFVFSTGPVIDSLSLAGTVFNGFDLEVPENVSILLYANLSDTAVTTTVPDYISRVDQSGSFIIDNIRSGTYRLFALKDEDNSKSYNRIEEPFAFADSVIRITTADNFYDPSDTAMLKIRQQGNELYLFTGASKTRYLINSSRDSKYKLMYALSLPPDTMDFNFSIPDFSRESYFIEKNVTQDTITVWITDSILYSSDNIESIITYPYTDSLGNDIYKQDTISMRFITPRRTVTKSPGLVLLSNIQGTKIKPGFQVVFRSETPLTKPDTSGIYLYEIADKDHTPVEYSLDTDTLDSGILRLAAELAEGSQYLFVMDSGSVSNIYNEKIDSTSVRFTVGKTEEYSNITITVSNFPSNCIIQLLNNTEKQVAEQRLPESGIVQFRLLDRGTYRVKAIHDLDGDGKWTTGDYFAGRQPEPVTYFPKELLIQEGWFVKEAWDLSVWNLKVPGLRQKPKTSIR